MEKVFTQRELPTKTITEVSYISIDGTSFGLEKDCVSHENNCINWRNTYLKLHKLIPRAYSLAGLKEKLIELEVYEDEWMRSSFKDLCNYKASVYGLKEAIKIVEKKGK